jgi:serine/threonine protein phosphatase 1
VNGGEVSRLIAIGDIHGCSTALKTILDAIDPQADDTIVTLGDYIDRGPDSRGVIDLLLDLQRRTQLVPLRGNHEIMMLQSFENYLHGPMWVQSGGLETLASYDGAPDNVPVEHINFMRQSKPSFETEKFLFVHANYDANLPLAKQPETLLYWEHIDRSMPRAHYSGKTAIVGHTPQRDGEFLDEGHLICLDTFCCGGGWLTALELNSRDSWQANQLGELRA